VNKRPDRRMAWPKLTTKWTICLSIFILLIIAGVIAGAVKGSMVAKEKVIERISSITTSMASTPTGWGATSGVASVVSTGKEGYVTASPAA